jgi:hypothetical protein
MNYVLNVVKGQHKVNVLFFNAMSCPDLRAFFVELHSCLCKLCKITQREERNLNTLCSSVQDCLKRLNCHKQGRPLTL